jgi:hypothetical protein
LALTPLVFIGVFGPHEMKKASDEGKFIDKKIKECMSSPACKKKLEKAVKKYLKDNDSLQFRTVIATRLILGTITGTGPAGVHGAVDKAIAKGATDLEKMIPGIIYGSN